MDLLFAASSGFLCWQTGAHAQNDAAMYGFLARYALKNIDFVFKYHEGLIDWPYRQFYLGLSYHFHAK